jgi:N6-L-threonylcarbamoyladenine synthase
VSAAGAQRAPDAGRRPRDGGRRKVPTGAELAGPILCVETSCDDTSAAVVRPASPSGDPPLVLSSIVSSQNELHAQFGGVVPEVASRRHTELLPTVVAEAMDVAGAGWDDVAAVATTVGPGLIGALLVGLAAAKAFAYARRLPLIPVDHLQGHIAANFALGAEPPFVCLVASGGHTLLAVVDEGVKFRVAGRTMDDAAGEAFDKGARLLGLGYPGGKELDELAARGRADYVAFPRAVPRGRDFSFSGLKTALLYDLRDRDAAQIEEHRADIAASYQAAIVRQLVDKTMACAAAEGVRRIALAGGVAANSGLRHAAKQRCDREGFELFLPLLSLCTDNAAMIGLAAGHLPIVPWPAYLDVDAYASVSQRGRGKP